MLHLGQCLAALLAEAAAEGRHLKLDSAGSSDSAAGTLDEDVPSKRPMIPWKWSLSTRKTFPYLGVASGTGKQHHKNKDSPVSGID